MTRSMMLRLCCTIGLELGTGFPGRAGLAIASDPVVARFPAPTTRVDRGQLTLAMRREKAKGYNLMVSTTAGRFTSAVLLDLAGQARRETPAGPALLIHFDDWFEAYRLCMELDSAEVPDFVALQRKHRQCQYVEYSSVATPVEVQEGPSPVQVLRVWAGWPDSAHAAKEYTFVDTAAHPDLQVTNERYISYWLVDYGDFMLQDQVEGVRGRPLEGALGLVFKAMGSGRAQWSRTTVSPDGLLVTYACARKGPFSVHPTTTTLPNGYLVLGLPEGREDLKPLEELLKQEIRLHYGRD